MAKWFTPVPNIVPFIAHSVALIGAVAVVEIGILGAERRPYVAITVIVVPTICYGNLARG
jgi:hypothetical protein